MFTHLIDESPLKAQPALENDVTKPQSAVNMVDGYLTEMKLSEAEATTQAGAVAGIINAISKCNVALNVISENSELVQDAIKVDSGLSPREANFLRSSLKQLDEDFGNGAFDIPALESMGGDQARSVQSEIALENMKEKFSKVWARIVEMLEKLKAKAKGMYRALFGSFENLKKAADAADKKFGSLGDTLKDGDFSIGGLDAVAVDGKANYDKVPAGLTALVKDGKAALDDNAGVFQAYADAVADHVGADIDDGKLKAASAKVASAIEGLGAVKGGKKVSLGGKDYTYADLMGGAGLLATGEAKVDVSGDTEARAEAINAGLKALSRKVGPWKAKVDGEAENKKATPWKQGVIVDIATNAGKIADYLLDTQKAADATEKALDDVAKAAKKRASAKVDEDKKALAKEVGLASALATKLATLATVQLSAANHIASVTRKALAIADKTAGRYA